MQNEFVPLFYGFHFYLFGLIALASPPLSRLALQFLAAEYFSLMVLGLVGSIVLAHGSLLKAVAMVLLGADFYALRLRYESLTPAWLAHALFNAQLVVSGWI